MPNEHGPSKRGFNREFGPRLMHPEVCSGCGKEVGVPFRPPVFCHECYSKRKLLADVGPTLEKVSTFPEPRSLAMTLSCFANTGGGTVIIGADDKGHLIGVPEDMDLQVQLSKSLMLISPPLVPAVSILTHIGRKFAFIEVQASQEAPHFVGDQWYERIGTSVRIGSPLTLQAYSVSTGANPEVPLAMQRLIAQVSQLSGMLRKSGRWTPKVRDMVIGGIIGAIISLLVGLVR